MFAELMSSAFELGDIHVDPETLSIGAGSNQQHLEAKVMDVLVYLKDHAPRTVSSDELIKQVWGRVIVGDNTVHRAIGLLRKALDDKPRSPRYIETVPKRGYRVIAEVRDIEVNPAGSDEFFILFSPAAQARAEALGAALSTAHKTYIPRYVLPELDKWNAQQRLSLDACRLLVLVTTPQEAQRTPIADAANHAIDQHKQVATVMLEPGEPPLPLKRFKIFEGGADDPELIGQLTDLIEQRKNVFSPAKAQWERPSLVVLPFRSLAAEESQALGDGLLCEIVQNLSLNKEFFVIASGTSLTYKAYTQPLHDIAEELGVRYAVTGTMQHVGENVRLIIELSDAQLDTALWATTYDRKMDGVFELQDEISRDLAVQLQPRLTRAEIRRATARSAEELTAWELFQRARTYNWSYKWLKESINVLQQALALDDNLASAHGLLSARLAYLLWYGEFDHLPTALEHLNTAMELQPGDPFIQLTSAIVNMQIGKPGEALVATQQALNMNPNLAEAWAYNGVCHGLSGEPVLGAERINMAFRLSPKDPLAYIWHLFKMVCAVSEENYPAAIEAGEASIALNKEWFFVHMSQAVNYAMVGERESAQKTWQAAKALNDQVSIPAYGLWLQNSQLAEEHQYRLLNALKDCGCS